MDTEQIFTSLKRQTLQAPAYKDRSSFPEEVEHLKTLEELIWWFGTTDFSTSHLGGDFLALSTLAQLHSRLDFSRAGLMQLISFITNLDTPGYMLEHESKYNEFPVSVTVSTHEAVSAIKAAVRQRPYLRKAVAQYIIFEELGIYDAVTLAQVSNQVEQEYKMEFGETAFVSSTRDVANALAATETEREALRMMLHLALEIGTHHIRCRLAINWLAHVHLRDPALQSLLESLKQMTMKHLWEQKMHYSSDDSEFLLVLLQGGSFEGQHN